MPHPSPRGRARGPFVGLLLALLLATLSPPAQAATTLTQVRLSATVTGSTVTATAVVSASSAVATSAFGVCARDVRGGVVDFPMTTGVTIAAQGTPYSGSRTFAPGTYSYRPCAQVAGVWQAAGVARTFSVAPGSAVPRGVAGRWSLTFEDDFDGTALDLGRWRPNRFDGGPDSLDGPFNPDREAAYFTAANVAVTGGSLALGVTEAPATVAGRRYSYASGTVSTQGRFAFGPDSFVEARVWVPVGDGLWPAFWAVPEGRWPPEIDGFEFFDTGEQQQPSFNYHDVDPGGQLRQSGPDAYGNPAVDYRGSWHTYGVQRQHGLLVPWLDGTAYPRAGAPSTDAGPMFVILNLSVQAGAHPPAGARMLVDSVRAWSAQA